MGEAAEAGDDIAVNDGELEGVRLVGLVQQGQQAFLIRERFRMHQGHQDEGAQV
ncbi:hypothetical protein D3C87_1958680 [compost metagenome]